MENKVYPISELFTNPQGEGEYAGAMMGFIRLAGCTVGKPFPKEYYQEVNRIYENGSSEKIPPQLPIYTEQCTLYDGRTFACDTNYKMSEKLSVHDIMKRIPLNIAHICITGGEPFMHDLNPLVAAIDHRGATAHVETSGTINLGKAFPSGDPLRNHSIYAEDLWVTVSPKKGILLAMIARANEIKLLVDENFNVDDVPLAIQQHPLIYIQPVNGERTINAKNVKRVMELQKQFPNWRVSLQLHKVLEHFIQERVL